MTDDLRPLPIYMRGEPTNEDIARIRRAKEALNLPFKVVPRPAAPGGAERILCIGSSPTWAQDYAKVPDTNSPGLKDAIAYVLGDHDDPRATTTAQWLSEVLGAEVKELERVGDVH